MRLVDYDGILYLYIKNTGKSPAHHIRIKPTGMINNSDNTLFDSALFATEFELYPEEAVQGSVSYISSSICDEPFPQITVDVSYRKNSFRKKVKYSRTVTYSPAFDKKVSVDTNLNFREIESSVKSISRSANRTANYLDGKICSVMTPLGGSATITSMIPKSGSGWAKRLAESVKRRMQTARSKRFRVAAERDYENNKRRKETDVRSLLNIKAG